MTVRSAYSCQLQGCNFILVLLGLLAVALAGTQFSPIGIDNYRDIDLRLFNWIHVLTGVVGAFSIAKNHGCIATKSLYCISIIVGVCSAILYGFTIAKVAYVYNELRGYRGTTGFETDGYNRDVQLYKGKLAISGTMIGVGALSALVSLIALVLLDRLAVDHIPLATKQHQKMLNRNTTRLTTLAVLKLLVALGALTLATYLEYQYSTQARDQFIRIALDHIAAAFAICSAVVDLYAIGVNKQTLLNLKVSVVLSIVSAVFCIKAVDWMMEGFFAEDLLAYHTFKQFQGQDQSASKETARKLITAIIHGCLIGCLVIIFFLSSISAVQAGSCMEISFTGLTPRPDRGLVLQRRCLGLLHVLWGALSVALMVVGFLNFEFSKGYNGATMLWLGAVFIATGVISSGRVVSMATTVFVLSVVSLSIAIEHLAVSIHRIFESSSRAEYFTDSSSVFTWRIVLYSIQTALMLAESVTALISAIVFGKAITRRPNELIHHSRAFLCFLSLGALFYGVLFTGVRIVFELGKWRYNQEPLVLGRAFVQIGNGPFAVCVFVVMVVCLCKKQLILPASILQVIVATLGLFVVAPCMTNVYYLFVAYPKSGEDPLLQLNENDRKYLLIGLVLTAVCSLACVILTAFAAFAALRSSFLLHHKSIDTSSVGINRRLGSGRGTVVPVGAKQNGKVVGNTNASTVGSVRSTRVGQPYDQSVVYWSADENPYYYQQQQQQQQRQLEQQQQQSRYYGGLYQVQMDPQTAAYYANYGYYTVAQTPMQQRQQHHQYPIRRVNSSSQTSIGHVFDSGQPYAIIYSASN